MHYVCEFAHIARILNILPALHLSQNTHGGNPERRHQKRENTQKEKHNIQKGRGTEGRAHRRKLDRGSKRKTTRKHKREANNYERATPIHILLCGNDNC